MNADDQPVARWTRETLLFNVEQGTRGAAEVQHILDEVYRRDDDAQRLRHRRRRRTWGALVGFGVVVAGGTVAAVYLGGQPARPEFGTTCRAEAVIDADAIAVGPGADPVDGCRELWVDGRFGDIAEVPPLTACLDADGGIDVFPDGPTVCEALGLTSAAAELTEDNQLIVELDDRLVAEINATECRPVSDVAVIAEGILAESELDDWHVAIEPGTEAGVCGKVSVNSATRTVGVFEF